MRKPKYLEIQTPAGKFQAESYDHDGYKGVNVEFITNDRLENYPRILIDYHKDNPKEVQLQIWQDSEEEDSTVDENIIEYGEWERAHGHSNVKLTEDQFAVNIPGGRLEVTADRDTEYPAIEIEPILDGGLMGMEHIYRIRFEYNKELGLRVFTFDDPEKDQDYADMYKFYDVPGCGPMAIGIYDSSTEDYILTLIIDKKDSKSVMEVIKDVKRNILKDPHLDFTESDINRRKAIMIEDELKQKNINFVNMEDVPADTIEI